MRCVCTDEARTLRLSKQASPADVAASTIRIDGYNLLTTIEAALGGGVVLAGRDTLYRDIAGLHGTWRRVQETIPALRLAGHITGQWGARSCIWYLDKPVSNSGRLSQIIRALAGQNGWNWEVKVVPDPDKELIASSDIIATSDSIILDQCHRWIALAREIVRANVPAANVVDLGPSA
jgi:hypothetical protein